MSRLPTTIETISGNAFNYLEPEVRLEDVAHGLSHVCRFAGHTSRFYSVAEHSVLVARLVSTMDSALALPALWHDAHEAYIGDLPTPLKEIVGEEYREIGRGIDRSAAAFIGVHPALLRSPIIKTADNIAVVYEASFLMSGPGWGFAKAMHHEQTSAVVDWDLGLEPRAAKALFYAEHESLTARAR